MTYTMVARRYIVSRLAGDPVLVGHGITGVYAAGELPDDAEYPFVVMDVVSPFTAIPDGQARPLLGTGRMVVRAVYETDDMETVEPAAARISELLGHQVNQPIPGGGELVVCHYVSDFDSPQTDPRPYRSLGAIFRMQVAVPAFAEVP